MNENDYAPLTCETCGGIINTWGPDQGYGQCTSCSSAADQPEPEYDPTDDPCTWGEHDWKEVFGGECYECQRCGVIDC